MGLTSNPLRIRCGAEEETTARIVCECEDLASLRRTCLSSFFFDQEDIKILMWVPSGTSGKEQGFLDLVSVYGAQRA